MVDFPSTNLATGVNGAAGQFNIANNEPVLSVETLLTFCQSRLRTLDDQIRGKMDGQRANIRLQSALGDLQAALPKGASASKDVLNDVYAKAEAAKEAAISAGDKETYDKLCQLQGSLCGGASRQMEADNHTPTLTSEGKDIPFTDDGRAVDSGWGKSADERRALFDLGVHRLSGSDGNVSKEEAEGFGKNVENMMSNSRSNNEMSMISLQSMVSQRATALQLTTNMLNSMSEMTKGITTNIGH